MRTFSDELYMAFLDRSYNLGYNAVEFQSTKQPVEFYKDKAYVCSFMPNGEFHYQSNPDVRADVTKLSELFAEMRHAYDLYDRGQHLSFNGVENYKVLCEFGSFLLAAMKDNNEQLKFVTWSYSYDRESVAYGHYFDTDYKGARQDFAVRAGLIDEQKLFKTEDLMAIYDACVYRAVNDEAINYKDERKLQSLTERIEKLVPELQERNESEQEMEQDLGQEA